MKNEIKRKSLNEMSNEELWQLFPIVLSDYKPEWKEWYRQEETALKQIVGTENINRINHIGSTAVEGLIAKPTIDILMEINKETDTEKLIQTLTEAGYIYSPQPMNPAPHMMFMKGYTPEGFDEKVFHLHVRYSGDWKELYFRDYLRAHPSAATEYGILKTQLQQEHKHNRDAYTEAKSDFIQNVTDKGRQEFRGKYSGSK